MKTKTPYWHRRAQWAFHVWRARRGKLRWAIEISAIPALKIILSLLHMIVTHGFDDPFSRWGFWVQEFGLWNALHLALAIILILSFEWIVAPGDMDEERQHEIHLLKDKVRAFEERLKPNIWITGKAYGDSPITDRHTTGSGMNVGFTIENRSDSELHDVQVGLKKLEMSFPGRNVEDRQFITNEDMGCITAFPIMLEWNPDQQGRQRVLSTAIPAGTSRLVGLFSDQTILSVRHETRPRLLVSEGFVYNVGWDRNDPGDIWNPLHVQIWDRLEMILFEHGAISPEVSDMDDKERPRILGFI